MAGEGCHLACKRDGHVDLLVGVASREQSRFAVICVPCVDAGRRHLEWAPESQFAIADCHPSAAAPFEWLVLLARNESAVTPYVPPFGDVVR